MDERLKVLKTLIDDRLMKSNEFFEMYHMYYSAQHVEKTDPEDVELWIDYLRSDFD